ncbi:methyl-accepting chemotaxis protein [Hungatella hathewayi]|uniref:methyl-accepting chemotaxis protein n=1 Tax=Hungatella hathewayi TaxID=154046 RepID=UPI003565A865
MKKISSKILLAVGSTLIVLLLITGIVIVNYSAKTYSAKEKELLQSTGDKISVEAEMFFQRYMTIVQTMAADQNVVELMRTSKAGDDVTKSLYFNDVYKMLARSQKLEEESILTTYVADIDANVLFDSDLWVSGEDYDVTTRDWYQAVTERKLIITEPYEDADTGNLVVTIASPVYDEDGSTILGITAVDFSLDTLSAMVGSYTIGRTGYVILAAPSGLVLCHKDQSMVMKNVKDAGLDTGMLQAFETGDSVLMTYKNQGIEAVGSCLTIDNVGWKLITYMPQKEFSANTIRIRNIILEIYLVLSVLVAIAILVVSNLITSPVKRLNLAARQMAEGDLDIKIDVQGKDEVGQLAESLNRLAGRLNEYIQYIDESSEALKNLAAGNLAVKLKLSYEGDFAKIKNSFIQATDMIHETITRITSSADQVSTGAQHVSDAAQSLSQGVSEQASSVEELAAAISEISEQVTSNAENAKQARDKAKKVGEEMAASNRKMGEMNQAMEAIRDSSGEIGKIIKTIEDIAFQTNILALNAAVEAARAGEAGKGFAVVADEVRNLAGKSAEASKNTTEMIEASISAVENGTRIAKETAQSMLVAVEGARDVTDTIDRISSASELQAQSILQITQGVDQISSVVQTTSATAEESAASSEQMMGQAEYLKESVGYFQLKEV